MPVVKSVKKVSELVSKAATPAPQKASKCTDYSKVLNYEKHYGKKPPPSPKQSAIQTSNKTGDLNSRLIKVLKEEENLSLQSQADFKTPFIRQNYFQEIYESERGKALIRVQA